MHLDYLTIETIEGAKDVHILIITDNFMRYEQAKVTSSQTAKCTAHALWGQILSNVWSKTFIPVDLYFGTQKAGMNATTSTKFVQQLCERLKWAYKIAQQIIEKETLGCKQNYDHRI